MILIISRFHKSHINFFDWGENLRPAVRSINGLKNKNKHRKKECELVDRENTRWQG
ncbi:MAG: hypothetical protein HY015_10105 [Bacteroidetes bacterium]|nr:hypothetical protein [Bacteroidota bacterium]